MKEIKAIIQPFLVTRVVEALKQIEGLPGLTVDRDRPLASDLTRKVDMHFKIHGMDCAEEIAVLKRELGPVVGGEEHLSFDLLHGRMTILAGPEAPALETILQAIARTGMQAEVWREGSETSSEAHGWQRSWTWRHW